MSELTRRTFLAGVAAVSAASVAPLPVVAAPMTVDEVVEAVAAYPRGLFRMAQFATDHSPCLRIEHRDFMRSERPRIIAAFPDEDRRHLARAWANFQFAKHVFRDHLLPLENPANWPRLPDLSRQIAEEGAGGNNDRPARYRIPNPWA